MKQEDPKDFAQAPGDRLTRAAGKQLAIYALAAVAVLVAVMFVLNALAGLTSSAAGMSRMAVDVENNIITTYLRDEPPQMNSMLASDAVSGMVLAHVMEGLLRYGPDDELVGGVAERWQQEGNTVTFWLRDDARWSNGEPVTAHDFEFAWKNVLDPAVGSQYAFILYPILNAEQANNGEVPVSEVGVDAVDDRTLVVTLQTPIAYFERMVAYHTYLPVNEEFHRQTNGRYGADADEMLYNGPFMMTSWVHGASMQLEKNPYYWDAERIRLDGINYAHMTSDASTLLNLFKDDQIVIADLGAEMLEEAMLQGWTLNQFMEGTVFYTDFNHRPERLTSNLNLRKAMALVHDAGELVNRVIKLPGYLPGKSLFPVWLPGAEETFREEYPAQEYRRDITKAKEYLQAALDELGLDRLPPLVLLTGDTPVSRIQAEYYQEVFKRNLDIDLVIDAQIFRQRLEKMTAGDFDLVASGWGPDYNDPLTFGDLFASWNLNNRGRYSNPALDAQVRIAQSSLDMEERMRAFGEIQRIIHDDVIMLPDYERGYVYVTHPQVRGIRRHVIGAETDFTNAWIDAGE
ncbi:peptide ABC transporter substrate-binding protein [Pseudohongiella sp.]|uniref:Solute-binding protein family 5 domain-containing protein n=1 Tax=marine sediment metagenome TaxID=412755 RepID=A0A0F9W4V3_9ZZZZ|nr:peptide ABC transporter substrate-binding protein [Pseudohongiella sp.]HDZ09433.1 peptide ABC transporter substrate-binding protein [Pseudohongiella sp.]HEA63312.1 peptide ABC transporter substrate-binding protein [Pseudohongiella sp.]